MNRSGKNNARSFAFRVDLHVMAATKEEAYAQLQRQLAEAGMADCLIEYVPPAGKTSARTPEPASAPPTAAPQSVSPSDPMEQRIRQYASANQLVRLSINKGRGVKLDIPCRIIQFDADHQRLTVYHVDEKMVYTFGFNEIDDLVSQA